MVSGGDHEKLVLSFLLLVSLLACSGTSGTKNAGAPPPVTAATLQGYPLTLPAGGFVILVTTNHTAPLAVTGSDWWHDAVVYQIFAKAFNGGKLPTDRLDYLAKTGFTAIWTTPSSLAPPRTATTRPTTGPSTPPLAACRPGTNIAKGRQPRNPAGPGPGPQPHRERTPLVPRCGAEPEQQAELVHLVQGAACRLDAPLGRR
jgi:hypothetical protein